MKGIDTVVCLHGFWSHGTGMYLIKRRFENEYGMRALLFNYPSVRGTLDENAAALAEFMQNEGAAGAHIVGHSLGGVVSLRMLANHADAPPGRVVCLGSPLTGSRSAEFLSRQDWAEPIFGHSLSKGVVEAPASTWASEVCALREVGVIAGNASIGLGQFVAQFEEDNDGTVAVSETQLAGVRDHMVMPVSHNGMLLSSSVLDQAAAFLKRGEFLRETN
jgi:pimeloyl-ACP methyl ester carboxylesterase